MWLMKGLAGRMQIVARWLVAQLVAQHKLALGKPSPVLVLAVGEDPYRLRGVVTVHHLCRRGEGVVSVCWLGKVNGLSQEAHCVRTQSMLGGCSREHGRDHRHRRDLACALRWYRNLIGRHHRQTSYQVEERHIGVGDLFRECCHSAILV